MLLSNFHVSIGDHVAVETHDGELTGVIMPRYESASEDYLIVKLKSGYNAGIEAAKVKTIRKISGPTVVTSPRDISGKKPVDSSLPLVALLSTGGTIASKVDYRTGGVHPALTASELYESVPELANHASIDAEVLFSEYSENLTPAHWSTIAKKVGEKVAESSCNGIVISHGTDTMHYTASALSFALQNLPIPVVLVGAQRSSDRPSSDAVLNLTGGVIFAAKSHMGGVFVAMHQSTSDDIVAVHRGTRVRKNHTSMRNAFESIDVAPVALIKHERIEFANREPSSQKPEFRLAHEFDDRVVLLKYFPGLNPEIIRDAVNRGARAIIFEGTGLGHVSKACFHSISNAVKSGVMVCMTSQCIWGRVGMTVYDTGRDLLDIGVVPLSNMLAETALTKAMWVLANTTEVEQAKTIMTANLAGETTDITPLDS